MFVKLPREYYVIFISALILAWGAYFLGKSLQRFAGDNRTISVRGIGQQEVKATHGSWQIEFLVSEPTLSVAMAQFKKNTEIVKSFLLEHGFTEKEISVGPPLVKLETHEKTGTPKVSAEGILSVDSDSVEKLDAAFSNVSALFDRGVILSGQNGWSRNKAPLYSIKTPDFEAVRSQLLEDAARSAKSVAERFARTAEAKIGSIKTLTQGAFAITSKGSSEEDAYQRENSQNSYTKIVRVVVQATYSLH